MQLFSNYAQTYLQTPISASDTQIEVAPTTGGVFSAPMPPDYELLILTDGWDWEVVKLIERNNDLLSVERGFEGSARSWNDGTVIKSTVTKATLENFLQENQVGASVKLYAYRHFK